MSWEEQINVREYEGAIQNGHVIGTGNTGHTIRRKTQHNMCWTPLYTRHKTKTNKTKKTTQYVYGNKHKQRKQVCSLMILFTDSYNTHITYKIISVHRHLRQTKTFSIVIRLW